MKKLVPAAIALAALTVWTASAQDAKSVIASASKALGVDTLKTVLERAS